MLHVPMRIVSVACRRPCEDRLAQSLAGSRVNLELPIKVGPSVLVGVDRSDVFFVCRTARMLTVRRVTKIARVMANRGDRTRLTKAFFPLRLAEITCT
jgi:hypothetical protein